MILLINSFVGTLQCHHSFDVCISFQLHFSISVLYHMSLRGLTCSVVRTLPVPLLPSRCENRIDQGALWCSPLSVMRTSAADRYLKEDDLDQCQGCFNHLLAIYLGRLEVLSWKITPESHGWASASKSPSHLTIINTTSAFCNTKPNTTVTFTLSLLHQGSSEDGHSFSKPWVSIQQTARWLRTKVTVNANLHPKVQYQTYN